MRPSPHSRVRARAACSVLALFALAACASNSNAAGPLPTTAPSSASPTIAPTPTTAADAGTPTGYDQVLTTNGLGYLTVRDGVQLSINVMLPGLATSGPYPTVVEYSGYDPSNPDNSTFGQLLNTLGFAYVGINMRGTGCSGGSFRFLEQKQLDDGYDAIETIAAQPWVRHHKVGMVGISYSGISQLFVASTQPPSLAAITPLSVTDDLYRSTLYPGGLLNTGFAVKWAAERDSQAKPFGQAWTKKRSDAGDTTCAANQAQRTDNQDLQQTIADNPFYEPALADAINPSLLVDRINVPVFISGAWQDEQTGGHFPNLISRFTGTDHVYVTLTNGLHTESLALGTLARYYEFLQLYVAQQTPSLIGLAAMIPNVLYGSLFGVPGMSFPPTRFDGLDYATALAQFEADPRVRVLFEEGAADGLAPGAPAPRFEQGFASWPIPSTVATDLLLGDPEGDDTYAYDPDATPDTFYRGSLDTIWRADTAWDWGQPPSDAVVAFDGPALAADTVLVGPASADLWITSTTADTDLEVTITEVRPDGKEVYVQSGWLRASQRALDEAASTTLHPVHTQRKTDASPLEPGVPTLVRVDILPFGHVFRTGSRIRVVIGSPGGNRAQWSFDNLPAGGNVTVLHDAAHPSKLVLPVIPGVSAPAGLPACGALRGQPCRTYAPLG